MNNNFVTPIEWREGVVHLIDQRRLPTQELWIPCHTYTSVADSIREMVVRGAPAIGIAAAYGVALAAAVDTSEATLEIAIEALASTRPTAINLFWALDRMRRVISATAPCKREAALLGEARAIHEQDLAMCKAMGDHGAALLPQEARVLTHCNAGALATGGWGTALGVIRSAWRDGHLSEVYADETRPFLQGSRLTAWELNKEQIPVTVITDNMAAWMMAQGRIDAVVVGTDRVAANGDIANKIGTYGLAVLAAAHKIPFYVVGPTSTIDLQTLNGDSIPIERRSDREVTHLGATQIVPTNVPVENPAFDITPERYVTAIITEYGSIFRPFSVGLEAHVQQAAERIIDSSIKLP